jgi:hypothetical protein
MVARLAPDVVPQRTLRSTVQNATTRSPRRTPTTTIPRQRRAALVLLAFAALAPSWLAAQQAYPLRFQAGGNTASATGVIKGPNEPSRDYVVAAAPGTTLTVTLRTQSPGAFFTVLDPYGVTLYANQGDQRTSWSGRAVDGGNDRIRVFLDDATLRQGKAANYTINVAAAPQR